MNSDRKEATQRIKDLAVRFNRASKVVRIPYRHRLMYWIYYIALARRGVMFHSATRDAQYEDGFLKRQYDKYCEKINRRLCRAQTTSSRVEVPSFEHGEVSIADLQLLMQLNIPFVIRNGIQALPVKDWTLDYLEDVAGPCKVPINEARDRPAADLSHPTKAHHYYDLRTGTLSEVVSAIRGGGNMRISTAEDVMHHDNGRLREDLGIPYWEKVSGWESNQHHWWRSRVLAGKVLGAQMWMQPQNAFTLWHAEPGDNFFVLAKGVKSWTLAHPYYTAGMRPRVKRTTNYHGSNIDVRESDDELRQRGFAGYLNVPKVHLVMQPGDVFRVPNYWWHTVETHPGQYTLAVSIRVNGPPKMLAPGYTLLRWIDPQYLAIAKSFAKEGRIFDSNIGYPRKPRATVEEQVEA